MKKSLPVLLMSAVMLVLVVSFALSYELDVFLDPDDVVNDDISEFRNPGGARTDIVTSQCSGDFTVYIEVVSSSDYLLHQVTDQQNHFYWEDTAVMNFCSADVTAEYVDEGEAENQARVIFEWPYDF